MKIKKYLLRDDEEGFFDVFLFNEEIELEELENFIKDYKVKHFGEWNIDNISHAIMKKYNLKNENVILFDYMARTTGDINGDVMFEVN